MAVDIAKLIQTGAFREAEDASWLSTTCDTSVADGKMEHYDQVVALSQGMINHALKKMHERIPGMGNFDGSNCEYLNYINTLSSRDICDTR